MYPCSRNNYSEWKISDRSVYISNVVNIVVEPNIFKT
jgi:hypothetical protein